MAAPLFVTDEDTLKARLRLTAVPATALDTEAIIDEAILRARVRFYSDLGKARVDVLLATAFTELPETDEEVLRALAYTTEVKLVYCLLLRMLPNTWMDSSGDVNHRWNEEAPVREKGWSELAEELKRCENEVVAAIVDLAAPETVDCNEVQVFDGTPDDWTCYDGSAPRIGQTLNPNCPTRRTSND